MLAAMSTEPLPWWRTEVGWCAALGLLPAVHGLAHLAEQWSAFGGRIAWLARMRGTSGPLIGVLEVAAVAGYAAWLVLQVRALRRPASDPSADETALARAHGSVARPAALLTAALAVLHALLLWLPRMTGRASLLEGYELLRTATGTLPGLVLAAVGLTAFSFHLAAGLVPALSLLGALRTAEARQAARLVTTGLGACALILGVQLAGWHATGAGTVWPVHVVAPDDAPSAAAEEKA
jgi:succinate dehydrogenase/fumarate reductase cytochrome b subunit